MLFLANRKIIEISEFKDLSKIKDFFQSIMTNDIKLINENANSIYSLFLNSMGRILFDSFLIITNEAGVDKIFLDIHSSFKDLAITHIKKYKMRLDFKIVPREDLFVFSDLENLIDIGEKIFEFVDGRSPKMKNRIVKKIDNLEKFLETNSQIDSVQIYDKQRLLNLILEGGNDFDQGEILPINFGFHSINSISLSKGCYLGQETTNRLFRTSVLRKSIVLICFSDQPKVRLSKNQEISFRNSVGGFEKIGNLVSFYENLNMLICMIEKDNFINELSEKKEFLKMIFEGTRKDFEFFFKECDHEEKEDWRFEKIKILSV
jgi:folate-binding protein YgfZ